MIDYKLSPIASFPDLGDSDGASSTELCSYWEEIGKINTGWQGSVSASYKFGKMCSFIACIQCGYRKAFQCRQKNRDRRKWKQVHCVRFCHAN